MHHNCIIDHKSLFDISDRSDLRPAEIWSYLRSPKMAAKCLTKRSLLVLVAEVLLQNEEQ